MVKKYRLEILFILLVITVIDTVRPRILTEGLDFLTFYSVGLHLSASSGRELYNISGIAPPYLYSPFAAIPFVLVAELPFSVAKLFWISFKLLTLLASVVTFNARWRPALILGASICIPAFAEDFIVGNLNVLLLTGLLLILNFGHDGKFKFVGFISTILSAFKPQLALVWVASFVYSPGQTVLGTIYSSICVFAAAMTVFSPSQIQGHMHNWLGLISVPLTSPGDINNQNFAYAMERIFGGSPLSQLAVIDQIAHLAQFLPSNIWWVTFFIRFCICGGFAFCVFRYRNMSAWPQIFAMAVSATFLLSPVVWITHYSLLVIPLAVVIRASFSKLRIKLLCTTAATCMFLASQLNESALAVRDYMRSYAVLTWLALLIFVLIFQMAPRDQLKPARRVRL